MVQSRLGKVFALEGTPGAGKSTLIQTLRAVFNADPSLTFLPEAAESIMGIFPLGRRATVETEIALLSREAERVARMHELIAAGTDVIADRCWISNTILAALRKATNPEYGFDPHLFAVQERVFQILHPQLLSNTVLIFLDLPPSLTFERQPWRQSISAWVEAAYIAYHKHIAFIEEHQPVWGQLAAERAAAPAPEPPPPGVAASLPEPVLSPYAGIERVDARQSAEAVVQQFAAIFEAYTGRTLLVEQ